MFKETVMKPTRRFPATLHVMAVSILASGFIGNILSLSADDALVSLERGAEILLADVSADEGDVGAG